MKADEHEDGIPAVAAPPAAGTSAHPSASRILAASQARRPSTARRDEIVVAATDVFAIRGYRNASLEEIADRVGITRAGVLHHFGSKEKLLTEVLTYRDQADVAEFEGHRAPTGMEFLVHLVRTAAENEKRPGIVQSYAVLSAEAVTDKHPAQAWFRDRYDGLRAMVREALREAGGNPPESEVEAATAAIIALMDGLQVQWLLDRDAVDMPETVQFVIAAILSAWGVRLPPRDPLS